MLCYNITYPLFAQAITIMRKILPLFFLSIATVHAEINKDPKQQKKTPPVETSFKTSTSLVQVDNQPTELETIVVTSPLQAKLSEATTPVTVLEGDDLTMKMGNTIGETLKRS